MGFQIGDLVKITLGSFLDSRGKIERVEHNGFWVRISPDIRVWCSAKNLELVALINLGWGIHIEQAIERAIAEAKRTATDVHFEFNGVDVFVPHKDADAKEIHAKWHRDMDAQAAELRSGRREPKAAPAPEATAANATVYDLRRERDHWQEEARVQYGNRDYWRDRAEKAEAQLEATRRSEEATEARANSLKVENAHLRECLAKFTDGGMSGAEVRAAKDDERARFERETAARLIGQTRYNWNNGHHPYTIETSEAIKEAKDLADHYFPAKDQTS